MYRIVTSLFLFCALSLAALRPATAVIAIDTVLVGNPGNANDPLTGFGNVNYEYRIGTTEVNNDQYAAFLSEKAKSDPFGLYSAGMGSDRGGITRSGVSGSYTYAAKPNMGSKPLNFVSWYDSIRFANWLNNGQGAGDTETGAYTLGALGADGVPINGDSITRNAGAAWFLPSENEWYKAAYHQPASQGGDSDNYWLYPTRTNSTPNVATADAVGNISNPGANVANYLAGADWNAQNGNVTTVGSAGPLSNSFYGTADQGGNVFERNEALISASFRGVRGGSFSFLIDAGNLQASARNSGGSADEGSGVGFRMETVPEPTSLALASIAVSALWWRSLCRHRK